MNILPAGPRKKGAHTAAGRTPAGVGPAARRFPPSNLFHVAAGLRQHGSAHAQDKRTAGWEIDMGVTIVDLVP